MREFPPKVSAMALALALIVTTAPAQAYSPACFDQADLESARIHDLRIMLMVNSLKCRVAAPSTLGEYRAFEDRRSQDLAVHDDRLEQAMIDRFGPHDGRVAFDRYQSSLSNYHSGFAVTPESCADTAAFIKLASRANHAELETLSKLVTNRTIDTCLAPAASERDEPGELAPRPRNPVVFAAGPRADAPANAPEIVDGVPTYRAPGLAPVVIRAPELTVIELPPASPPVAAAAPAPVIPGNAREDKLAQAISALDAAAAALRDMQQAGGPAN